MKRTIRANRGPFYVKHLICTCRWRLVKENQRLSSCMVTEDLSSIVAEVAVPILRVPRVLMQREIASLKHCSEMGSKPGFGHLKEWRIQRGSSSDRSQSKKKNHGLAWTKSPIYLCNNDWTTPPDLDMFEKEMVEISTKGKSKNLMSWEGIKELEDLEKV